MTAVAALLSEVADDPETEKRAVRALRFSSSDWIAPVATAAVGRPKRASLARRFSSSVWAEAVVVEAVGVPLVAVGEGPAGLFVVKEAPLFAGIAAGVVEMTGFAVKNVAA